MYWITVTAGSGLDFTAKTTVEVGAAIGGWTGTLSDDKQFVQVPGRTLTFTSNGAQVTTTDAPLTFKLVSYTNSNLTARLYTATTSTTSGQTCKFQVKDLKLANEDRKMTDPLQGTSSQSLDSPVALKRWGSFDVTGMGLGMDEGSYRHAITPVISSGQLPQGIVLDDKAWAVKTSTNAIWFYVMLGFSNQGDTATCLRPPTIDSVENSASLPVFKDITNSVAAPAEELYTIDTVCLRPGDRGWVIASVSVATNDSAAFGNAAVAKVSAPYTTSSFSDAVAPTPYRIRYTSGSGLHVDVIDAAYSVRAVFLDSKDLPVGTDSTYDYIPAKQSGLKHLVYTYSFAEPEVLGTATKALVYTAVGY